MKEGKEKDWVRASIEPKKRKMENQQYVWNTGLPSKAESITQ